MIPDHDTILRWLRERDPARLQVLFDQADQTRAQHVGHAVHLRGLVEVSNHCTRQCGYCGLRAGNTALARYRMSTEEVLQCALRAAELGFGTVVLQAGEDPGLDGARVAGLVARIKRQTSLAVTLSLGERTLEELARWRRAGADRYLLRFETSDRDLFDRIHPPRGRRRVDRVALLQELRRMGYEIGSGIMVGIPGQSWDSVACDLEQFHALDLDMIGVGPWLPHPATPLGAGEVPVLLPADQQVPHDETSTLKVLALARLMCPDANLPSTTALATIDPAQGREKGLCAGANVVMPNLTPPDWRVLYEIYPGKACVHETAEQCAGCLEQRIRALGRHPGRGPGGRRRDEQPAPAHPATT